MSQKTEEFTSADVKRFSAALAQRMIKHAPEIGQYLPAGTDLKWITNPLTKMLLPTVLEALWHGPGTMPWYTVVMAAKAQGFVK